MAITIKPNEQTLYTAQLKNCSINFEIFLIITDFGVTRITVVFIRHFGLQRLSTSTQSGACRG